MAVYVKVTPIVADRLGYRELRNKTADGNYLLWQSDITEVDGGSLSERIEKVGGAKLSPVEAKAEIDGRANPPAECFTPEDYEDNDSNVPEEAAETVSDVEHDNEE